MFRRVLVTRFLALFVGYVQVVGCGDVPTNPPSAADPSTDRNHLEPLAKTAPLPDLAITRIEEIALPRPLVRVTVTNLQGGIKGSVTVQLQMEKFATGPATIQEQIVDVALVKGSKFTLDFPLMMSCADTITILVDPYGMISEYKEANNFSEWSVISFRC